MSMELNKANECTCPSGDGSLRHPCPAHPAPVEQAGGDERDFQAKGAQEVPSPVSKEYDRHLIGLLRKGEALPGHQEEAADEIERLRDWNDHLNNTVLPNILNPNFLMLMKGGERLLDLCTKDGEFIGVSLNDMKDVFDWMVTHARIAPDQAALAQPSPAQAEQHWQKLEKPAQVGAIRFRAGLSSRLVVEAAQRLYEFESTPEKEAERIERLQAFREQCFEPLGAEFSKVLSENLVELSSDAKPEQADEKPGDSILCYGCFAKGVGPDHFDEAGKCLAAQAEAERPEVVARVVHSNPVVLGQCGPLNANDELMTVAQHAASVARWAEMFNRVEQQRDSALARVAELELGIARIAGDFLPDNCGQAELALDEMRQALHELLAAPPTQAQHSVPEGWRIERSAERIVVMNLKNGAGYAAARDGESGIAESVLYLLAADLLAAAPGKEGV
ncbi:hypothetical protein [Pseudomonas aeruginosa]|uniref:hypothetical protein n=1 Tax=Pseudomonas aeruginosa TaxID=287 RepID=UPI0029554242|nr:hypothetical protein [Pseudomonas aeruginosa]MDV7960842.1 hypothetical protein [Pseudomonas aeruginosa]